MKTIPLHKPPIKLKINLENMPHSVYRKILVPEDINMLQLHLVIQIAMGWTNSHLFQFQDNKNWMRATGLVVSIPNPYDMDGMWDEGDHREADKVPLKEIFLEERGGKPFWYWYDFGDDWWHRITFQKVTKKDMQAYAGGPVCTDAFGACPPEDVGGPWGYNEWLTAVMNKEHPEYAEMREWAGLSLMEKYNPDFADIKAINAALSGLEKENLT
jgi:hypothetical protein